MAELGEGPGEEQVADRERPVTTGLGDDRWPAAPQRSTIEDVVVHQGRHVDELDRGGRADRRLARSRAGAEQHEHRAQALAPGRQGRAGVRREVVAVSLHQEAQALLDRLHPHRQPGVGGV